MIPAGCRARVERDGSIRCDKCGVSYDADETDTFVCARATEPTEIAQELTDFRAKVRDLAAELDVAANRLFNMGRRYERALITVDEE